MTKKIAISTLIILSIINTISFILVLFFMNPDNFNVFVNLFIFWFTFLFSFIWVFSLIFYSIKRIHLRGFTDMNDLTNSIRQAFLFAIFLLSNILFYKELILNLPIFILLFVIFLCLELLINNLFSKWKK